MSTETRKVLAQIVPPATTLTDAYTVPLLTQTVISSLIVCNMGNNSVNFRISVAVAGIIDNPKQYCYYDIIIDGPNTFVSTIGITLGAGDVIRVYSGNGDLSFNFYGVEIT